MNARARVIGLVVLLGGCASWATFNEGATRLDGREQRALVAAGRARPDGFARFWLRPNCRFGLVKWSEKTSHVVKGAPPALLDLIRDEVGRVNRAARTGETVFLSVTVFRWEQRWFGRPPLVGFELVGRDRAGQILWMGEDSLAIPRSMALNLAEPDELLIAREIGQKLQRELSP